MIFVYKKLFAIIFNCQNKTENCYSLIIPGVEFFLNLGCILSLKLGLLRIELLVDPPEVSIGSVVSMLFCSTAMAAQTLDKTSSPLLAVESVLLFKDSEWLSTDITWNQKAWT